VLHSIVARSRKIDQRADLFGCARPLPGIAIVSAENNIGWLPYYLQRTDRTLELEAAIAACERIASDPEQTCLSFVVTQVCGRKPPA